MELNPLLRSVVLRTLVLVFPALAGSPHLAGAELPMKAAFHNGPGGTGWQIEGRQSQGAAGGWGVSIPGGSKLVITVDLDPGLYELIVQARGGARLTLGVSDPSKADRSFRMVREAADYSLLFKVETGGPHHLSIASRGEEAVVATADLLDATNERKKAWAIREENLVRLGYPGIEVQRPAPGGGESKLPPSQPNQVIRQRIVFYDPDYDTNWVEDAPGVVRFFAARGFEQKNARELTGWLDRAVRQNKADGTSVTFVTGVAPAGVFDNPIEKSLVVQYLQQGGRVVWVADIPLNRVQDEFGPIRGISDPRWLMGLETDPRTYYGIRGEQKLTAAAKAWGLEGGIGLTRPVRNAGFDIVFNTDSSGEYAGTGLSNFKPANPWSGLIYLAEYATPNKEALLRDAYRLATYTGEPVQIPQPDPYIAAAKTVEAWIVLNEQGTRTCFLRSERIAPRIRGRRSDSSKPISVKAEMLDVGKPVATLTGEAAGAGEQFDIPLGEIDLADLRVGRYPIRATICSGEKTTELASELRIAPEPDHTGLHWALWVAASPSMKRTEHFLEGLKQRAIEPLFVDDLATGRDLALWHRMSFSVRRHGESKGMELPQGDDIWKRSWDDQILPVLALGNKREAHGYANPLRRDFEAEHFGRQIAFDNQFPAFRQRALTGDDYSQWFGPDYNRHAVAGFRKKHGIEAPRPPQLGEANDIAGVRRGPGLVPDDDPWILLNRFWAGDVLGAMGKRLARAMKENGGGQVGPIPGGMQIPAMMMWSAMYPPLNFGPEGFSLNSFYYYNTLWQPPLAHLWWLEAARMGNREMEQWIMPDTIYEGRDSTALYDHFAWLCLAGGATGVQYFCGDATTPAGYKSLERFGKLSRRYGTLLGELRPARKKVGMLVPFPQLLYDVTSCYRLAYPFFDLLQAQVDVEPIAEEELTEEGLPQYDAIILARVTHLSKGAAGRLERYVKTGGKVLLDGSTAASIQIEGAVRLPVVLSDTEYEAYDNAGRIAQVREALASHISPVAESDNRLVVVRRFVHPASQTPFLWITHATSIEESLALREELKATKDVTAASSRFGYGSELVVSEVSVPDVGRTPLDIFSGKPLQVLRREKGRLHFRAEMPKWQATLVAFVPALPASVETMVPKSVRAGEEVALEVRALVAPGRVLPVPVPLSLRVENPAGHESAEYSRRAFAGTGVTRLRWRFAKNDLPGVWRIVVEDTVTGLKSQTEVRLERLRSP